MGGHSRERPRVGRGAVFAFSVISWFAIFGLVPWLIGRRGRKLGWQGSRPSVLNRLGIIPFGLGVVGLGWCLVAHYEPGDSVAVSLVPENLIAKGPYRRSRNPMYVCEEAVLLGWTIYYGSPELLAGMSALGAAMRYAVGREERTLEDGFGDSWREYASQVRRWI